MLGCMLTKVYKNESGCSEVCRCVSANRTALCRALPCTPHVSCKLRDVIYGETIMGKAIIAAAAPYNPFD